MIKLSDHLNVKIIFGDASSGFDPSGIRSLSVIEGAGHEVMQFFLQSTQAQIPVFLYQVHGADGMVISSVEQAKNIKLLEPFGDFLITNVPGIMLGILTGDCLPVVVYDPIHNVIGAAHAGWRGSVAGVLQSMIGAMKTAYGSCTKDLLVAFGPSAKTCCYEVDSAFRDAIATTQAGIQALVVRDEKIYFDVPLYNKSKLIDVGVLAENIDTSAVICTICSSTFHSYRRDKTKLRQITGISLK
jgi:hypothetical protein